VVVRPEALFIVQGEIGKPMGYTTRSVDATYGMEEHKTLLVAPLLASSPGRFFANTTAGEKYGLVLIVSACALF